MIRIVLVDDHALVLAGLRMLVESHPGLAVVGEASQIGNSASDFSAMSEELAASSGEISTAMVKIASSAEQQVKGMEKADDLLASLRQIAEANAGAAARVSELGDRIQGLAARHRADVTAAGQTLLRLQNPEAQAAVARARSHKSEVIRTACGEGPSRRAA